MKKAIVIGFVVLLVAIGAGVYLFLSGLDEIVKAAVEKVGSDVTKVEVTLDRAEVAPTEGRAALHGLVVGNPPGFKADSAFAMGSISVTLDAATVTQDPIVIKEVAIAGPEVTYELGAEGSNIDAINKNVQAYGSGSGAKKSDAEGPKVIVENLYVRGGKVNVSAAALGGSTMTAALPEIHLRDIGKEKGGATPGEVAEKVMAALTSQVGSFVGGLDISSVLEGVTDLPEGLKGLTGALEQPGAATEGAQDTIKGVEEEAGDAVKKLLGD